MRAASRSLPLFVLALLLTTAGEARGDDELKIDWGVQIQTDLRFRVNGVSSGDFYNQVALLPGVERNQNRFGLKFKAKYGQFSGVADIDFILLGYSGKLTSLNDLTANQNTVQPYRFDVNSLYIEAKDIIFKGLDLRIGQQIVLWGVGDQFNPTNNLNPDDLRDPLLFGKQAGNFMVKADYWLNEDWSMSGVLVPVFKPALLPPTAPLGIAAVDRLPFTDPNIRYRLEAQSAVALDTAQANAWGSYPTVVTQATPVLPDMTFGNMQWAYRIAGTLGGQDLSLSYYDGRTDFPQPTMNTTTQLQNPVCDPVTGRCVAGTLNTNVLLGYPQMHVYGFNAAGEIPLSWIKPNVHGIGYRFEGALVVPHAQGLVLNDGLVTIANNTQQAGIFNTASFNQPGGPAPTVVTNVPFVKTVVGLDYSFGDHVYANVQWVHGLMDEYGVGPAVRASGVVTNLNYTLENCVLHAVGAASNGTSCAKEILRSRIGDYAVVGVDLKFLSDKALMRLFGILDASGYAINVPGNTPTGRVQTNYSPFTPQGFSMVLYPDFNYNFGKGLELGLGALIQLGNTYTKFGDPAAGGFIVFTRARYSF